MAGTLALGSTRSRSLDALGRLFVEFARPVVDRRNPRSRRPFGDAHIMLPHLESRRWGWSHYGFFVPDLPAPYRYMNTMTLIGTTGTIAFDNDLLAAPDARDNATVLASTASGGHYHYRAYDARTDCDFAADGSSLRWGADLEVTTDHPTYRLRGNYGDFGADLEFTATEHVSYFVNIPGYQHFSLLAPYRGSIIDGERRIEVSGVGTVDYARAMSPQVTSRRPLAPHRRLPVDFFTYQILPLPNGAQLLLTDVRIAGASACRLAHVRWLDRPATVYTDVSFEVLEYGPPLDEPNGDRMAFPRLMRWTIHDGHDIVATIVGDVDSRPRYGHGNGFVAAMSYTGTWMDDDVAGTGYLEWIDCEPIR
ncbi:DUF6670 family protein [Millisia brevis]|uniref:DUF6670 family protein n=1 Tax=Millisia brevis TaxID=264148 RepID=UPI001FDEAD25|nr:DUF6670 family protein [Millisia brevis]